MKWLGVDVGGANLKVADGRGFAKSLAFPLWRQPHDLSDALRQLICAAPRADGLVVTMTGELADCFQTKVEGVLHILNAVASVANAQPIRVYLVDGRINSLQSARSEPLLAAASNWHALARFVTRFVTQVPALLIDVGSTTTDIIPLDKNGPSTQSRTDINRLLAGELVYLGMTRTPIAAVTDILPYRGHHCPIASESFATTADSAVLLGIIPEDPLNCNTADGRPLTKCFAQDRMARMICADRNAFDFKDALEAARFVWERQTKTISTTLHQVVGLSAAPLSSIVVSGSGIKLAEAVVSCAVSGVPALRLSDFIGDDASSAAPAHAVAVLAFEGKFAI